MLRLGGLQSRGTRIQCVADRATHLRLHSINGNAQTSKLVSSCKGRGRRNFLSASKSQATTASMEDQVKEKNEKYPVMIYAKSWCPYCGQVKGLFNKLQVDYTAVNLDEIHEGDEIQDALVGMTGSHTVPQVFVKGEFIGGCDETMQLSSSGELQEKLKTAGIRANE